MEKRKEFAGYMRSLRNRQGLSKFKAARALGYKTDGTINTLEQGKGPLPVEKIHPIARLYGVDVAEILKHLKECEPELYEKYTTLHNDIGRYIMAKISPQNIEIRAHHAPFPYQDLVGFGKNDLGLSPAMSDNVRNVNKVIYIMSTILSETATHQKNPPRITKTAHLLQITPQTTKGPGNPFFAQGAPYYVEYRGNAGLLN